MTSEIQTRKSRTDPWTDLDRFVDDLRQQFFHGLGVFPFGPVTAPAEAPSGGLLLRPARVDVIDTGKSYKITAEIPGVPKENLDIRIRGTSVEIRGESSTETRKEEESVLRHERTYAGYFRSLDLPEDVIATDAKAKVENGVLELELPKRSPAPSPAEVKVAIQ
jgi:HSP20 family protein